MLEKDRLTIGYPGNDTGRRPKGFKAGDEYGALWVLERLGPNGPVDPGPRDATLAGFEVIQRDYDRDKWAFWDAFRQSGDCRRASQGQR